jgi:hypothetical protein
MNAVIHVAVLIVAYWWAASLVVTALFATTKHRPEPTPTPLEALVEARAIVWVCQREWVA